MQILITHQPRIFLACFSRGKCNEKTLQFSEQLISYQNIVHKNFCRFEMFCQPMHFIFENNKSRWAIHLQNGGKTLFFSISSRLFEPHREKTGFLHMRKQRHRSASRFAVTAKLISAFVFATRIVQSLYFLNLKFQSSYHLL